MFNGDGFTSLEGVFCFQQKKPEYQDEDDLNSKSQWDFHYIVFQPLDVAPRPQEAGPPSERSEDVLASRRGDDFFRGMSVPCCIYYSK